MTLVRPTFCFRIVHGSLLEVPRYISGGRQLTFTSVQQLSLEACFMFLQCPAVFQCPSSLKPSPTRLVRETNLISAFTRGKLQHRGCPPRPGWSSWAARLLVPGTGIRETKTTAPVLLPVPLGNISICYTALHIFVSSFGYPTRFPPRNRCISRWLACVLSSC